MLILSVHLFQRSALIQRSALLAVLMLFGLTEVLSAQLAVGPVSMGAVASQVGITAAVRGPVHLARGGQAGRVVQSGESIYIGDVIETDAASQLQIMLLDETVFTIGPGSSMVIDEFVYNPADASGVVKASVTKGVFRFVTGKIARKKPSSMEVKLPTGTIGIRGTIVLGSVQALQVMAILLGPGEQNNTGNRAGSFTLKGDAGGKTAVTRAGYGTKLAEGGVPSAPFDARAEIAELKSALAPKADAQQGGAPRGAAKPGPSASEAAGQDTAGAREPLRDNAGVNQAVDQAGRNSTDAVRDAARDQVGQIQDGISRLEQLRTVPTGQFHFRQLGVSVNPSPGSYDFKFDIDFGARTVGGGNSGIVGNASIIDANEAFDFRIPAVSFASGSGNAVFEFGSLPDQAGPLRGTANIRVALNNRGGVVAENADQNATITEQSGVDTVTGSGVAGRVSGLS